LYFNSSLKKSHIFKQVRKKVISIHMHQ
jgi:hypothetical protein